MDTMKATLSCEEKARISQGLSQHSHTHHTRNRGRNVKSFKVYLDRGPHQAKTRFNWDQCL